MQLTPKRDITKENRSDVLSQCVLQAIALGLLVSGTIRLTNWFPAYAWLHWSLTILAVICGIAQGVIKLRRIKGKTVFESLELEEGVLRVVCDYIPGERKVTTKSISLDTKSVVEVHPSIIVLKRGFLEKVELPRSVFDSIETESDCSSRLKMLVQSFVPNSFLSTTASAARQKR